MTVAKLSAGDGYTYYISETVSADVRREAGQELGDYYLAHGNPPGVWTGSGISALGVDGEVTEAQMKALYGEGLHPDADRIIAKEIAAGATPQAPDEPRSWGGATCSSRCPKAPPWPSRPPPRSSGSSARTTAPPTPKSTASSVPAWPRSPSAATTDATRDEGRTGPLHQRQVQARAPSRRRLRPAVRPRQVRLHPLGSG